MVEEIKKNGFMMILELKAPKVIQTLDSKKIEGDAQLTRKVNNDGK